MKNNTKDVKYTYTYGYNKNWLESFAVGSISAVTLIILVPVLSIAFCVFLFISAVAILSYIAFSVIASIGLLVLGTLSLIKRIDQDDSHKTI